MSNERKVRRGENRNIQATTWNTVMDVIKQYKQQSFHTGSGVPSAGISPNLTVLIRNDIGTLSDSFRVMKIGEPLLTIDADIENSMRVPAFSGVIPDSDNCPFAIVQTPAEFGLISSGVIGGITLAFVEMVDTTHTWANPVNTFTDHLRSTSDIGAARILHHQTYPGGFDLAIIDLIGCGSNRAMIPVEITSVYPDPVTGYAWKFLSFDPITKQLIYSDPVVTGNNLYEVANNKQLTQGSRVLMTKMDDVWVCEVQEEFPAELTSTFASGYSWKQLKLASGVLSVVDATHLIGTSAYEVDGNTNLQIGDKVWMRKNGDGWVFDRSKLRVRCAVAYDSSTDTYYVDPTTLAGTGLKAVIPDKGCPYLEVDTSTAYTAGCNIDITKGTISTAFDSSTGTDGIYAPNGCTFTWRPGCGMTVGVSPADGKVSFTTNMDTVAGDKSVTALVAVGHPVAGKGDLCPSVGIDFEKKTSESASFDKIKSFGIAGGDLVLTVARRLVKIDYNLAGLPIDIQIGAPADVVFSVPFCAASDCCAAAELMVSCGWGGGGTPIESVPPVVVTVTSTPSGGVSPYTYDWDWGDGTSHGTTASDSHTYKKCGAYTPTVFVGDKCGNIVACTPGVVTVDCPVCCEEEPAHICLTVTGWDDAGSELSSLVPLDWISPGDWESTNTYKACSASNGWVLACEDGEWSVALINDAGYLTHVVFVAAVCSPFSVQFTATLNCSDSHDVTLTFTERTGDTCTDDCTGWYCCPDSKVVTFAADCDAHRAITCTGTSLTGPYATEALATTACTPAGPGTDCPSSLDLAASTPFNATHPGGIAEQWYKFSYPSGSHTFMKLTISASTDSGMHSDIYVPTGSPDCSHLFHFDVLGGNGSIDKNMGAAPWVAYIKVTSTPGCTYTIQWIPEF